MMPITFPEVTRVLGPPSGREGDVGTLPIADAQHPDGTPVVISCWELSEQELADLIRTRRLWVSHMGTTLPPFLVQTVAPFLADRTASN